MRLTLAWDEVWSSTDSNDGEDELPVGVRRWGPPPRCSIEFSERLSAANGEQDAGLRQAGQRRSLHENWVAPNATHPVALPL